MKTRLDTESVE